MPSFAQAKLDISFIQLQLLAKELVLTHHALSTNEFNSLQNHQENKSQTIGTTISMEVFIR